MACRVPAGRPADGRYLSRDDPELAGRGLRVAAVAGAARFHPEALASEEAAPGRPLELRRDPENPYDPNAVAVHRAGGGERPAASCRASSRPSSRPSSTTGTAWSALCLREQRRSPREPRTGLTMLLGRAEAIELREVSRGRPR